MSKPVLYLLGPMWGYIEHNRPAFKYWTKILREANFDVISPDELDELYPVPTPVKRTDYYRRDLPFLAKATLGGAIPGWRKSPGASYEAYTLGILLQSPVYELSIYGKNQFDMDIVPVEQLPRLVHPDGTAFPEQGVAT